MKPTVLHPVVNSIIRGLLFASALAILPASALAQRGGGAGGHAGVAHAGGIARPAGHVPTPTARPSMGSGARAAMAAPGSTLSKGSASLGTRPIITRPGIAPLVPFRAPAMSAGLVLPRRPPGRPPIFGFAGSAGSAAFFAYNPFLLRTCGAFVGFVYGCGVLPPYFGFGYNPASLYPTIDPTDSGYPSAPVYPSEPAYNPPDPFATLQYTPVLNQAMPQALPPEDVATVGGDNLPIRSETLLCLNEGSVFAVASYTVSAGRLHYVTAYGDRNDIAVDQIDVQKTIQANAARGVAFTLTPAPAAASGDFKPTPLGPSPAPEGPITPGKQ